MQVHAWRSEMQNTLSKTIIAGLAALSLGASALATAEPATAAVFHGHGGGFHGGWHGGGVARGGGYYGGGGWWGPAIVGGLAAGALAAPYAYGYGYGYPYNGCYAYQPMYDAYGNYIGQQPVRTC
jgi:hypothetical protein